MIEDFVCPMTYEEFCRAAKSIAVCVYNPINYAYFWHKFSNIVYCFAHESPSVRYGIPEERWVCYKALTFQEWAEEKHASGIHH